MLNSTPKKTGRPIAIYTARDGTPIVGLMKLGDGRWRASGPERFTFSEADERLAIARYLQWKGNQAGEKINIPLASAKVGDNQSMAQAIAFVHARLGQAEPTDQFPDGFPIAKPVAEPPPLSEFPLRIELRGDRYEFVGPATQQQALWFWLRQLILEKPAYVSQMTGIEQIAYLGELPKPTPSPTLEEVGLLYIRKSKLSSDWKSKSKQFWREFCEFVEVQKLRELTQELAVEYADMVLDLGRTPTYARQRFGAIKAIINYPTKRGKWSEDCKRALTLCAVLVPPERSAADPHPIEPKDFASLYRSADAVMKTALLLSLNCCMYGGEVAALNWSDMDLAKGVLVTDRAKTKVIRVAVLWPETVSSLRKLPRESDALFLTSARTQARYRFMLGKFNATREAAGLPNAHFASLRDGAYTAAVEGGADLNLCKLLAGHATGISDSYVQRKPSMVAAACDAIRRAYKIDKLAPARRR